MVHRRHHHHHQSVAASAALFGHEGLLKVEIEHADAGDIIGLTGFEEAFIGDTITDSEERLPLPFVQIDPPTITMSTRGSKSHLARKGLAITFLQEMT